MGTCAHGSGGAATHRVAAKPCIPIGMPTSTHAAAVGNASDIVCSPLLDPQGVLGDSARAFVFASAGRVVAICKFLFSIIRDKFLFSEFTGLAV